MLPKLINDFPRRSTINHNSIEELKIRDAVNSVENLGAHPLLTDAVILLGQAKDKVSDYLENHFKGQ